MPYDVRVSCDRKAWSNCLRQGPEAVDSSPSRATTAARKAAYNQGWDKTVTGVWTCPQCAVRIKVQGNDVPAFHAQFAPPP